MAVIISHIFLKYIGGDSTRLTKTACYGCPMPAESVHPTSESIEAIPLSSDINTLEFIHIASQAAMAEQNAYFVSAASLWSQAALLAKNQDNQMWCNSREERCLNSAKSLQDVT